MERPRALTALGASASLPAYLGRKSMQQKKGVKIGVKVKTNVRAGSCKG